MREVVEPVTRKVFEGEACRVTVQLAADHKTVEVFVDRASGLSVAVCAPDDFAALSRDLAAVNERVQEFARELVRAPVGAGVREPVKA